MTTSGSLGLLLAPSLPLILYGVIVQQMDIPNPFTIQELFLAGILPALLMIVLLTFYSLWSNRDVEIVKGEFSRADAISASILDRANGIRFAEFSPDDFHIAVAPKTIKRQ